VVGVAGQIAFADALGNVIDLPGGGYAMDFNPTVDRIRITTDARKASVDSFTRRS
jgi:hypothetical protein